MTPAALAALLALALVAVGTRPGDGRSETAVALPLVAAVGVSSPLALPAVLVGVLVAYGCLVAVETRTLLFGRRLRALAAVVGAAVPLAALGAGAALGRVPVHPEVWLAGAVVPGVLAYDLRRLSLDRRTVVGVAGAAGLVVLVAGGVAAQTVLRGGSPDLWAAASAAPTAGVPLLALAVLVLGGLAAGVLARWRYGLHVAPLSVPLLAVWTLETLVVPATYVLALAVAWVALPTLRQGGGGRRVAAVGGLLGALVAGIVLAVGGATVGAAGLPVLLAGVLAAEDARLLRGHAGRDRTHAVAIAASSYALLTLGGAAASTAGADLTRASLAAALTALAVVATIVVQRERARPSEQRLRTEERRWTP